jgi:hypothetical protein
MAYSRDVLDVEGTFLDKKSYKEIFPDLKQDTFFSLYYLKYKDIFMTLSDTPDSTGQEITDEVLDREYRELYLKISKPPIEFIPIESDVGTEYDSDLKYLTIETVIANGQELETKKDLIFYYMSRFDFFVAVELVNGLDKVFRYTFQDNSLRKKYNIPYQDERFSTLKY